MSINLDPARKDWLLRNKEAINERLDESFAAAERGESYSPEEAKAILSKRRTAFFDKIEESIAQGERGEVFTEEEVRTHMVARRASTKTLSSPPTHQIPPNPNKTNTK